MTPRLPPQGRFQPGLSFDAWFLAGVRIGAENARDDLAEARWRIKHAEHPEASPYLGRALTAWIETRASIQDRARRVALGYHSLEWAFALLCLDCPEHCETLVDEMRDELAICRAAIDRQVRAIEWRIRPLCAARAPGEQIIAAAMTVGGPLPRRRVVEVCRQAAKVSLRRRHA